MANRNTQAALEQAQRTVETHVRAGKLPAEKAGEWKKVLVGVDQDARDAIDRIWQTSPIEHKSATTKFEAKQAKLARQFDAGVDTSDKARRAAHRAMAASFGPLRPADAEI